MAADYRKFKTPYYEIQVGDSTGKRLVKLPHHIIRLVEKVEIVEAFTPEVSFSTLTIDFVEGSREPASPDASLGTQGLYKIPISAGENGYNADMNIAGSITNRAGSISDLRFSGSGGITFLTASEKKSGAIDRSEQENIVGDTVTRAHNRENKRPIFLFQERNQVKITWGYLEDPASKRSIRGYIIMLQTTFPENGQVRTTVTCQPTLAFLDQIAPTKGIKFGTRKTVKGNSIVTFEDSQTDAMLHKIASDAGMAAIISKDLLGPNVDSDKTKMWIGGESFNQFMMRLAAQHDCYYEVIPHPETGQDTLIFIKRSDFESRLVITDRDLTTWKTPGSILKNVSIKADFGMPTGNMQKGVNNEGDKAGVANDAANVQQFYKASNGKTEQLQPNNPVYQGNPIAAAVGVHTNIAGGSTTGTLDVNPSNSRARQDGMSQAYTNKNARNIVLEFTTLGYTKFSPGVIEIRNIGVRYSGKYRLQTVTHTLDSSGYITKGTAVSFALAAGGVTIQEAPKAPDEVPKDNVQQFKPAAGVGNQVVNDYQKLKQIRK